MNEKIYKKMSNSRAPRVFVVVTGILLLAAGLHILFAEHLWPGYSPEAAVQSRALMMAASMILTAARILFTLLYLLKRSMNWEEALGIPFAFSLYFLYYGALVRFNSEDTGWLEWMGLALFLLGSGLNTGSELARHAWKKKPENKGRLYTRGPFSLARHINYTGDILWVTGMGCITASWLCIPVIIFIFCFFAFFNGPMLDRHLAEKYGDEYFAWARETRSLIPGIY